MSTQALTEAVYYILLVLLEPKHGYGIMQDVEELSKGRIKLAAGTLYGALTNLQKKGWIILVSEVKERKKKEYLITEQGKKALEAEIRRLEELVNNGHKHLKK